MKKLIGTLEQHKISKTEIVKFNNLTYRKKLEYWDNVVIKKGYAVGHLYYPSLDTGINPALVIRTIPSEEEIKNKPMICIKPDLKNPDEIKQYLDWRFEINRCESPEELDFNYLAKIHTINPEEGLQIHTSLRDGSIDEETKLTLLKNGYADGSYSIKYLHELNVSSLPQLWFAEGYYSVMYKRPVKICEACFEENSYIPIRQILKGRVVAKMIKLLESLIERDSRKSEFKAPTFEEILETKNIDTEKIQPFLDTFKGKKSMRIAKLIFVLDLQDYQPKTELCRAIAKRLQRDEHHHQYQYGLKKCDHASNGYNDPLLNDIEKLKKEIKQFYKP